MELRTHQSHEISGPHLLSSVSREEIETAILLMANDDTDIARVVRHLQERPALGNLIIRAVNAVRQGNSQPVKSLQHALIVLGLERSRNVLQEASLTAPLADGRSSVA